MIRRPLDSALLPHDARGMTLVELLVGFTIFGLVVAALTAILYSSTHQSARTSRRATAQGNCRQALSLMETEIRQAGMDPSIPPAGVVGIVSGDSVSVRVRMDLSGDGVIQTTEPSEDVTYAYTAATRVLTRNPGAGAVAVTSDITNLRFTYFDASNNGLIALPLSATDAALVTSIGVTLTTLEGDSRPITLTTRINLRNR